MIEMSFSDEEQETYKIAILIKESAMKRNSINYHYVEPLEKHYGVNREDIIALSLEYDENNKATKKKVIDPYLEDYVVSALLEYDIEYVLVADGNYFKVLANVKKSESYAGLFTPLAHPKLNHIEATYLYNFQSLIHNPNNATKIDRSLAAIGSALSGSYITPGDNLIHKAHYIQDVATARDALNELMDYPHLALDIEAFSLRFYDAHIATCAFAVDQHNGIVIDCDVKPLDVDPDAKKPLYFDYAPNYEMRKLFRTFLTDYQGKLRFHNSNYDVKVAIFTLFMDEDLADHKNMVDAVEMLLPKIDDTKLVYYLATNNASENRLGLKEAAAPFTGNYALDDIKDIRVYPLPVIREYNLIDALATNYVWDTYYPAIIKDNQLSLYNETFQPSIGLLLQTELHGTPINIVKVKENTKILENHMDRITQELRNTEMVSNVEEELRQRESTKMHDKWKTKTADIEHFNYVTFNPNSDQQKQLLLYEYMDLPVLDTTDSGAPSCSGDTLKKLVNHTTCDDDKLVVQMLLEHAQIAILVSTFMSALVKYSKPKNDWYYLYGNFNLGGTLSGRLSSSKPNLQNIPGGRNQYAKLVKECFEAAPNKLFTGADFASLEDRVSALTTKDTQKLKVYSGSKQYEIEVNGVTHRITEDTVVSFDGKQIKGDKLYERLQNRKP